MFLKEYLRQNKGRDREYESMITIQFLPKELETIRHALYFYNQSKEERFKAYGENEETKIIKEIKEVEEQLDLIDDFENYGIDEIITNLKCKE